MEKSNSPAARAGFERIVARLLHLQSFVYVSKDKVGRFEIFSIGMHEALANLSALESFTIISPNRAGALMNGMRWYQYVLQ